MTPPANTDWLDVQNAEGPEALQAVALAASPWSPAREGIASPSESRTLPFPVEVFPPPIRDFVAASSEDLAVPVDYMGLAVLATLSTAIGSGHVIEIKDGWTEDARIWLAVIGRSASNKSGALSRALGPLYDLQKHRATDYQRRRANYEQEMARRSRKDGEILASPTLQQVMVQDTTMEGLGQVLQHNPRGVLLIRDELAGWVGSMDAYRKGADREAWLSLWNHGLPAITNRKTQAPTVLPDGGFVSVVGGMPPGGLSKLRSQDGQEDGFLPRFLMAFPEPLPERLLVSVPVPTDAYVDHVRGLWATHPAHNNPSWDGVPITIRLGTDAYEVFRVWHDTVTREASEAASEYLNAALGKLPGQCARLALILHCSEIANGKAERRTHVGRETMGKAIHLANYFGAQARRIAGELVTSPEDRQLKRLVEWLDRRPGARTDLREIYRNGVANIKGADAARRLVEEAEDRGLVAVERSTHGNWTITRRRPD